MDEFVFRAFAAGFLANGALVLSALNFTRLSHAMILSEIELQKNWSERKKSSEIRAYAERLLLRPYTKEISRASNFIGSFSPPYTNPKVERIRRGRGVRTARY